MCRKFTSWDPTGSTSWPTLTNATNVVEFGPGQPVGGIDVLCSNHQEDYHDGRTGIVREMLPFRRALHRGDVIPVEFGPTTILQVQAPHDVGYVGVRKWDLNCSEMPPRTLDSSFDILVDDEGGSYDAAEHLKVTDLSFLISLRV